MRVHGAVGGRFGPVVRIFDPFRVPRLLLFAFSDASSFVCFTGDGKQWEGDSDRYKGDEREEGERVGDVAGITCQKTCGNE